MIRSGSPEVNRKLDLCRKYDNEQPISIRTFCTTNNIVYSSFARNIRKYHQQQEDPSITLIHSVGRPPFLSQTQLESLKPEVLGLDVAQQRNAIQARALAVHNDHNSSRIATTCSFQTITKYRKLLNDEIRRDGLISQEGGTNSGTNSIPSPKKRLFAFVFSLFKWSVTGATDYVASPFATYKQGIAQFAYSLRGPAYPDCDIFVYVDASVSQADIRYLEGCGARVVCNCVQRLPAAWMDATTNKVKDCGGMFLRYLAFDDLYETHSAIVVLDADLPDTPMLKRIIQKFNTRESPTVFRCCLEAYNGDTHKAWPLAAGLFGVKGKVLKSVIGGKMQDCMREFAEDGNTHSSYGSDQTFLACCIFPLICKVKCLTVRIGDYPCKTNFKLRPDYECSKGDMFFPNASEVVSKVDILG